MRDRGPAHSPGLLLLSAQFDPRPSTAIFAPIFSPVASKFAAVFPPISTQFAAFFDTFMAPPAPAFTAAPTKPNAGSITTPVPAWTVPTVRVPAVSPALDDKLESSEVRHRACFQVAGPITPAFAYGEVSEAAVVAIVVAAMIINVRQDMGRLPSMAGHRPERSPLS